MWAAVRAARLIVAKIIRDFLPQRELLAYLTSILRVYNLEGRRDNLYKARIKILVDAMGPDAFRDAVEAEYAASRGRALTLPVEEIERVSGSFRAAGAG
jgi:sulfite reductase (NADPH) hemoprotein beta-component